jgi:membrane protease YdiL (CAAX protease family)
MPMSDDHDLFPAEHPKPAGQPDAPGKFLTPGERRLREDMRVPWGWLDLLLLVLLTAGSLFVVALLIFIGLAVIGVPPTEIQKSPADLGLISVAAQALVDLAVLGYLAAQMRVRFRSPFWSTIGWRRLETDEASRRGIYFLLVLGGAFLAVMVGWAAPLFPPKGELPIETVLQGHATMALFMVMSVLVAPLVEETVFRGYLYPVAARSLGVGGGVVLTGTLFGLLHSLQLWGGWWQISLLVVVGIVFTMARAKTGTVLASYVLHVSYNSLQVIALVIGTHGLRRLPGAR